MTTDTRADRPTPNPAPNPAPTPAETLREPSTRAVAIVGLATLALAVIAFLAPDRTVGAGMDGMSITHYMGLLAVNQPWNLLMFMALPVILAETLAITELVILFAPNPQQWIRTLSSSAGLLAGPVMVAITVHLLRNAVVPLTDYGAWRGPADVVAVLFYLAGAVPLVGITLVELGLVGATTRDARKWHAIFVGVFLVVAHVAMIFGMLDPTVLGWVDPTSLPGHVMPDGTFMPDPHG